MKQTLLLGFIGLLAHTLCAAESGPKNKVADATKQLADKANYSWTTSTKEADGSSGRMGPLEGKADKAGLTYLNFTISDVPVEVYMNGQKGTAKALEGWQSFDDVAQASGTAAAVVKFLRSYKAPAAESAGLTEKAKELKETEGAVSGDLKEEAVKELLLRGGRRREGQDAPKIENAKGTIKFWVKDGSLAKYEINVQGKVTAGDRENDVNRTITVEIKEAGTTKLELPAEAKEKMA
jgi:hypothetical protein